MQLIDFLPLHNIKVNTSIQSKKRALEIISEIAAAHLSEHKLILPILDALLNRERLGSTGIGNGVAIPHCRFEGLQEPVIILITLQEGIDFHAADDKPVDIILALLVPVESTDLHLELLAWIARQFSKMEVLQRIHTAKNEQALYNIIANLSHE